MAASPARVQGVTLKVEDVLLRLREGAIRVPAFQRPLKWRREDNRLFFDSLLKSFPVGSLLFWVRPSPAERVNLGPFATDVAGRADAWQVVDGQQRLTALAGSLLPTSERGANFDFVVHLVSGDIAPAAGKHSLPDWVPLAVLADTEQLLQFLHANPSVDVLKASSASKRLREYPLSATILDDADEAFVLEVFKRLNTTGKPLTAPEVFRASHRQTPAGKAMEQAIRAGQSFGFGDLDESTLLRALKALNGRDPLDKEARGLVAEDSLVWGASQTVSFLRALGIPVVKLVPYSLLIGVLVAFFGRHRTPQKRNTQLLGYWFWRAVFTFRMGGDFSTIRQLFENATRPNESQAVQALLADVGDESRLLVAAQSGLRSAEGKVVALFLIGHGPRHLETGALLEVDRLLAEHGLSKLFVQLPTEQADGLNSAIFHPPMTKARLRNALSTATDEVLWSHVLSPEIVSQTPGPDMVSLNRRSSLFNDDLQDFADAKRGARDSLRAPLSALEEAADA